MHSRYSNKIFQYASSIWGQDSLLSQIFHNKLSASTDKEKVTLFNNYFYSAFSVNYNLLISKPNTSSNSINDIEIVESDVHAILESLDVNKACKIDNISPSKF